MKATLDEHIKELQSIPDLGLLIQPLVDEIVRLGERVEELEGHLKKNSSNSSKPPSSDGYKGLSKTIEFIQAKNRVHKKGIKVVVLNSVHIQMKLFKLQLHLPVAVDRI